MCFNNPNDVKSISGDSENYVDEEYHLKVYLVQMLVVSIVYMVSLSPGETLKDSIPRLGKEEGQTPGWCGEAPDFDGEAPDWYGQGKG